MGKPESFIQGIQGTRLDGWTIPAPGSSESRDRGALGSRSKGEDKLPTKSGCGTTKQTILFNTFHLSYHIISCLFNPRCLLLAAALCFTCVLFTLNPISIIWDNHQFTHHKLNFMIMMCQLFQL